MNDLSQAEDRGVVASVFAVAAGERLGLTMRELRCLRRAAMGGRTRLVPGSVKAQILAAARLAAESDNAEERFADSALAEPFDHRVVEAIRHVAPLIQPIRD